MATRSIRQRTLTTDSSGRGSYGERGQWIEILDGGRFGQLSTIALGLRGEDNALNNENIVPCVAGTIVQADFDEIDLVIAQAVQDTVTVRIGFGPPPLPATGKPRVRWLSRGVAQSIGAFTALRAVDLSSNTADVYGSLEHPELLQWCGWITADAAVTVWETARANPAIPTTEYAIQSFIVRALGVLPAGLNGTTGSVCTFERGAAATPAPGPAMPNSCGIQIHNAGAGAVTASWLIGVRG